MIFSVKFFPFILTWMFVEGSIRKDKILFLQKSPGQKNEMLVVMTWTENPEDMSAGCEIFTDEESINKTLAFSDSQIRILPEDAMQILVGDCLEFSKQRKKRDTDSIARTEVSEGDIVGNRDELSRTNRRYNSRRGNRNRTPNRRMKEQGSKPSGTTTSTPSTTVLLNEISDGYGTWSKPMGSPNKTSKNNELERESEESFEGNVTTTEPTTTPGYDGLPIIFPGTKWCGAGDIAKSFDDLGRYNDTDKCCRAHDLCNDTLAPGETRNGLTNTSPFTKLSCRCDNEFHSCLDKVRSVPANTIGNLYFNILMRECYMMDYPPSKTCKKYLTLFKITCLEYEKDTSKEKSYQWVKAKSFPRI